MEEEADKGKTANQYCLFTLSLGGGGSKVNEWEEMGQAALEF